MSVRADRLVNMSKTSDSAVRPYTKNHRAAFLDALTEWPRIPSVPARPECTADIRRSADRLGAKLRKTGSPTAQGGAGPAEHPQDAFAAPVLCGAT